MSVVEDVLARGRDEAHVLAVKAKVISIIYFKNVVLIREVPFR